MEYLVLSAIGPNSPNAISELFLLTAKNECQIEETRMTVMGSDIAIIMMVAGNWNTIAKIEAGILAMKKDLEISVRRTKAFTPTESLLPYLVQIIVMNQPSLTYEIITFFAQQGIYIDDLETTTFNASFAGTSMLSLNMRIGVPGDTSIADFRESFALLCDELNMDGVLEPEKP